MHVKNSLFFAFGLSILACSGGEPSMPDGAAMDGAMMDGAGPDSPGAPDASDGAMGGCEAQPTATPIVSSMATVNGSGFLYVAPADPAGLVIFFHGGHGHKEDNFEVRPEAVIIARAAYSRGYAIASLDSRAHIMPSGDGTTQWDDDVVLAENDDVQNVIAMIAMLRGELAAISADAPIFVVGFSDGGSMASRVPQHMDVAASAVFISNAKAYREADATVPPTLLIPGRRDPGRALSAADMILALHPHVMIRVNEPAPVTPGIFTRVAGVDCAQSMGIYRYLADNALVDGEGMLTIDPKEDLSWDGALPEEQRTHERRQPYQDVLLGLYAGHAPSSDFSDAVFDLFDSVLP